MQIKANNNLYVCSELGGGIYYANGIAIRANRSQAFAWEDHTIIFNSDGTVSIKTANGFYWTAEEGGGAALSTNRRDIGPWEKFYLINGGLLCWDREHWVSAEVGSEDPILIANRVTQGPWETFQFIGLVIPIDPSTFPLIKGNFCVKLPGLNLGYAPNGLFFSPSYVVYDDSTRAQIRNMYKSLGYTHMPLNLTNHSTIYRNVYPQWDDTRINQYLQELLQTGIVPMGFAMGDHDTEVTGYASPDLVPVVIPKWEDSNPIKNPANDQYNTFYLTSQRYPKSIIYWHNPVGQGAPFVNYHDWGLPQDDPGINAKVWHYMVDVNKVRGILFQGKAWETGGIQNSINGLNDFVARLGHGLNGWPRGDVNDFEETVFYLFNMNGDPNLALKWAKQIRSSVPLTGYCNG